MRKGYEADLVAHWVTGTLHIRPRGTFSPLCNMKKAIRLTDLTTDDWRKTPGVQHCSNCERAAKFFGYLPK